MFRSSHEKLLYQTLFDIETDVLQNFVKRSFLVKLLYAYSSTKNKLPLKYFIRKSIEKNTCNSWWLLLVFLKNFVVTLKYYYEKKRKRS